MNYSPDPIECPKCKGQNLIDRYDYLTELGQTAPGCADPIWYCPDCQQYPSFLKKENPATGGAFK